MLIKLSGLVPESFVDGPGIRFTIFTQGCPHKCPGCHNPETHDFEKGRYADVDKLFKRIIENPLIKGITFSGGEPLLQSEFIIECAKILKNEGIHIALDTSGVGNGNYEELLSFVDLVLLDIKHVTKEGYKYITGINWDESLEFIKVLNRLNKKVWIRQVIVPGINDNEEYILKLKDYIKIFNNVEKIELLPYHTMGIGKYEKLNIDYPLEGISDMSKERCKQLEELLKK